jgi:hypothetical protein
MNSTGPSPPETPREPRPQFSLRALLGLVAVVAMMCAVITTLDPLWAIVIGWFVILVIGHVLGNSWSTRVGRGSGPPEQLAERPSDAGPPVFAPTSRLRHHVILGRAMFVSAALSAIVGCVLGTLFVLNRPETPSWTGLLIGSASSAVLGGLLGFLVSSFLSVGLCALHEACGGRRGKPNATAAPDERDT